MFLRPKMFLIVFFCGYFTMLSVAGYAASNGRMIDWWWIGKDLERSCCCLEGLTKTTKIVIQNGHCPNRDWTRASPGTSRAPYWYASPHTSSVLSPSLYQCFLVILHFTSYPMVLGALSPGVKRPGREADHSPSTSAEVKKTWIYTSTPPYAFMA
jgi:hypothetical protein